MKCLRVCAFFFIMVASNESRGFDLVSLKFDHSIESTIHTEESRVRCHIHSFADWLEEFTEFPPEGVCGGSTESQGELETDEIKEIWGEPRRGLFGRIRNHLDVITHPGMFLSANTELDVFGDWGSFDQGWVRYDFAWYQSKDRSGEVFPISSTMSVKDEVVFDTATDSDVSDRNVYLRIFQSYADETNMIQGFTGALSIFDHDTSELLYTLDLATLDTKGFSRLPEVRIPLIDRLGHDVRVEFSAAGEIGTLPVGDRFDSFVTFNIGVVVPEPHFSGWLLACWCIAMFQRRRRRF